ncbi:hypothetical protein AB6A40_010674 [Gnathostoma spinigerum]|uniref:Acyl-CoA oxidase C-terminal domain-containing protein n=1 Tax=Gnathostoma spinigerum TaxID=75299 RepID=A0ABD6EWW4_9BILA
MIPKLHIKCCLIKTFFDALSKWSDASIRPILFLIGRLFSLYHMSSHIGSFSKNDYMSDIQTNSITHGLYEILAELRSNAVAVADSFQLSDLELKSALGRRDGNVYKALVEWAKQSQLNDSEIFPEITKHLLPMMREARAKL